MSNYNDLANVLAKAAIGMATNNGSPSATPSEIAQAAIAAATKNDEHTSSASTTRKKADFNDINELLKNHWGGSYFYGSAIPEKKMRNARAAMGIPSTKKIYALYDNTIFGSAKEGACFTDNEIYGRTSSSSEVITYEELTKKTITYSSSGYLRFNDVPTVFSAWFDSLLVKLNRVNAPVDTTKAMDAMKQGEFAQCIKYLDDEETHVKYTQPNDLFVYRKLYVEANIAMLKMDEAAKLLGTIKKNYGTSAGIAEYIADAERRIADYKAQYERDLQELNQTLEACERLRNDKNFDEALDLLGAVELREDFTKRVKKDYYKALITTYLLAEKPDDAEAVINDLYERDFIENSEKEALAKQVTELREKLHKRYINEQRQLVVKQIVTAQMYEKYEIYESASDTLIAALSSAPSELNVERVNLFRMLADILVNQYEYEELYALGKQYSDVSSSDKLGYSLSERIEKHKAEHAEAYFDHLYSNLIYYMQNGKLERAERCLLNAKEIKSTFDLRCSEVNLAILKLDYADSRKLIDSLIADKAFFDAETFDEAIEQLEAQYANMIAAISDMLKTYAFSNNIEALMSKDGYDGFVDADGMNLPCIAARFANHKILDTLLYNGYGYNFKRTNEGFGIAFLAAMQLNYDEFSNFINARMDSYDGEINCVLNERLDYGFAVSEVTKEVREARGIGETEAREIAISAAYSETIFFMAALLDEKTRKNLLDKLANKRTMQESLVTKMKDALPGELRMIDEDAENKCSALTTASSALRSLLSDAPEDDYRTDSAIEELNDAVATANKLAKELAGKKKAAKREALDKETAFIDTIASRIDVFSSIDSSVVESLLAIPVSAIQLGDYDTDNHTMQFTLAEQCVEVEMSSEFASLIASHSEKIKVESDVQYSFENKTLTVVYNYGYSDGENSCVASFTKSATVSDELTEDKFIERILGVIKS